jgi:hypothetical protein
LELSLLFTYVILLSLLGRTEVTDCLVLLTGTRCIVCRYMTTSHLR